LWCEGGFYYGRGDAPGRHVYHEAGVYYIQEPSAMAPVGYLMRDMTANPASEHEAATAARDTASGTYHGMENERILDLCAAPGGKSTQIAGMMGGKGLLVTNEIHPARAKILSENIERMGVTNALVLNETPQRLRDRFAGFFTRILVDAPCSGEGMFRKNAEAISEWSIENTAICAARQDEILDCAAEMLVPGGRLVYSTCTFAPIENEGTIGRFIERHPEFEIEEVPIGWGFAPAVPEWGGGNPSLAYTVRLWPHKVRGEGHYAAVLRKAGEYRTADAVGAVPYNSEAKRSSKSKASSINAASFDISDIADISHLSGRRIGFGDNIYLAPDMMPDIKGLKVLRPGLHLGTIKKGRFEPSHALALAISPQYAAHTIDIGSAPGGIVYRYLNGETFAADGEKGWYLITADGFGLGWGKLAGGIMKNHYPKGLRKH
jgi:NOL1/NOP2/fmu family ribosome biogenesis protein